MALPARDRRQPASNTRPEDESAKVTDNPSEELNIILTNKKLINED
jgi:hypothetical protein